jgi:hypothetical protein
MTRSAEKIERRILLSKELTQRVKNSSPTNPFFVIYAVDRNAAFRLSGRG